MLFPNLKLSLLCFALGISTKNSDQSDLPVTCTSHVAFKFELSVFADHTEDVDKKRPEDGVGHQKVDKRPTWYRKIGKWDFTEDSTHARVDA